MRNTINFEYFGKNRNLKFDINAISDVEREMKTGITSIMNSERFGFDVLRVLLWAGLKHEDQSLTIIKIGNWIQKYIEENHSNLIEAMTLFQDKVIDALKLSGLFGDSEDEENLGN